MTCESVVCSRALAFNTSQCKVPVVEQIVYNLCDYSLKLFDTEKIGCMKVVACLGRDICL